jgi:exodeoxyribonuclease-3
MRITTWNVNGLRAAYRNGFLGVIETVGSDVVLLQEIRCRPEQLVAELASPAGWHVVWHPAERPGYAGTAVWSRAPIEAVRTGLGDNDADEEGRVLTVETAGMRLTSVYLPSGSSGAARQAVKETWMERFRAWADRERGMSGPALFGGDLNVARTSFDIFYATGNAKNSGFLPHERRWMDDLVLSGWTDFVRAAWGDDVHGPYTWWSNRGRARELDRGWRIDYVLGNEAMAKRVGWASVDRELSIGVSDHAPVSVDLG